MTRHEPLRFLTDAEVERYVKQIEAEKEEATKSQQRARNE
jgi:hypothetical protein